MAKSFDYTEVDLHNPSGNNALSARAKFFQRSLYKEAIYPEEITKPLHSWYDKNLFGRVDQEQHCVIPRAGRLAIIKQAVRPGMMCLDFVNVAFDDFVTHMKQAFLTDCIDRRGNSALFDLSAVMAYTNPSIKYSTYLNGLIEAFITSYSASSSKPIKNFGDFKPVFLEYLKIMSEKFPITMPALLLSAYASPMISGLKIAIANEDAGDDAVKYEDFVSDPNFLYYIKAAKKFGFLVDKNAPWILTADLFSDAMMKYVNLFVTQQGGHITRDNFFQTYFYKIRSNSVSLLGNFVRNAYRKFVEAKPIYEEEKIVYLARCAESAEGPLRTEVGYRAYLGASEGLTHREIIDLYCLLRSRETKTDEGLLKTVLLRAYELYRTYGTPALLNQVAVYVDEVYKDYLYPSNYGQINSNLRLDPHSIADILDTAMEVVSSINRR